MNERRKRSGDSEWYPRIAPQIQTRIDLLFTMSDNTQPRVHPDCELRIDVSRTIFFSFKARRQPVFALQASTWQPSFRSACRAVAGDPPAKAGGARRDRTDDLMLAKHALSQLSYGPVTRRRMLSTALACAKATAKQPSFPKGLPSQSREARRLVGLGRLELPTSRLSSARSNQLSYKP